MGNVSGKSCRKIKNYILYSIFSFQYHAVYEIMWKNMLRPDRPQMREYNKAHAFCMPDKQDKNTDINTRVQYILLFHATTVMQTRLKVTLPVLLELIQ
jgi:hypothetical protein